MKAKLLIEYRYPISENSFAEMVVWEVPTKVPPSAHNLKYRLAFVVNDICVLRFDNERGKGDHMHFQGAEIGYEFVDLDKLLKDFDREIRRFRDENSID